MDIVVKVDAVIAPPTSLVPLITDAVSLFFPLCRKIDSITMIELSTNIPTPSTSPPRDMMFTFTFTKYIKTNVEKIERTIAIAPNVGYLKFCRNNRRMQKARKPPPRNLRNTAIIYNIGE